MSDPTKAEYCIVVWDPWQKQQINKIEMIDLHIITVALDWVTRLRMNSSSLNLEYRRKFATG
jgi:hypothetical protein